MKTAISQGGNHVKKRYRCIWSFCLNEVDDNGFSIEPIYPVEKGEIWELVENVPGFRKENVILERNGNHIGISPKRFKDCFEEVGWDAVESYY